MQDSLRQYGVTVVPLGRFVRSFCLEQGNLKETGFLQTLKHAEIVWREIFRDTLWEIKTVAVSLCGHTINLPDDCERLINISIVDKFGRKHPLTEDVNLNTAKIRCDHKCSCTKCHGLNTLCGAIDSTSVVTTSVVIQGETYIQTTYITSSASGAITEVTETPTLNASTGVVEYVRSEKVLCNMDIDSKGCIKPTKPNVEKLILFCGAGTGWQEFWNEYGFGTSVYRELIPAPYNFWGFYSRNAADPSIIHIFRHDWHTPPTREQIENGGSDWEGFGTILITYQTNGEEPGQEIIIPEYANNAVTTGILWRRAMLNPKDGDRNQDKFQAFRREKVRLFKYLNPAKMEIIVKLPTRERLW